MTGRRRLKSRRPEVGKEERRCEVSELDKAMRNIENPEGSGRKSGRARQPAEDESPIRRIVVDKRTHRVRLENETESEVTVVIEEKGGRG